MNEVLTSAISGLIQGITELLPISSSAHVLLFSKLVKVDLGLTEVAILHIGTLFALLLILRKRLKYLKNMTVLKNVIISAIPAGVVGLLIDQLSGESSTNLTLICASLIFWGVAMIATDLWSRSRIENFKVKKIDQISLKQALQVGIFQILAFIPGTSRSGITTIIGIASGISPKTALEFSFFSGIPVIAASGFYSLIKYSLEGENTSFSAGYLVISIFVSFITGIFAAEIFQRYINKRILTIFGIYRILLSVVVLVLFIL